VKTRYGSLDVFTDDYIGRALEVYGEWAWLEVEFCAEVIQELLCENRLVAPRWYDAGAFIGSFSLGLNLMLSDCLPGASIEGVAIEADESHFRLLERNINHNAPGSIEVACKLLGPYGEIRVPAGGSENRGENYYLRRETKGHEDAIGHNFHQCCPLLSLRKEFGPYGLLKLDIEGMEFEVIQTDQKWILENRPAIYAECNESSKSIKLFNLLKWLGYKIYYFAFPAVNSENFNGIKGDILFNGAYEAALLAVEGSFEGGQAFHDRGCLFQEINSRMELTEAMWFTPRYVPSVFQGRSIIEMHGAVEKLNRGISYKEFKTKLSN